MFWAPCSSGGSRWVGGIWGHGGVPTHLHTHVHAHTRTHAHLYMYRNCKWLLTWRHPCLACLACLTCMCVRVSMHVCACVCMRAYMGHSTTYPYPPPPPSTHLPPRRGVDPRNHLKFDNTSTYQDFFQFRLKISHL